MSTYVSKIVLIGNPSVGKTSILRRLMYNMATAHYDATIGVDFMIKEMDIPISIVDDHCDTSSHNDTKGAISRHKQTKKNEVKHPLLQNPRMKFQLWDSAGQERFRTITSIYYKEATCVVFVFALDDIESFQRIVDYWYPDVIRTCNPKTSFVLIGNKKDRYRTRRPLLDERIKQWTTSNAIPYFETEMNDLASIEHVFREIGKDILKTSSCVDNLPGFREPAVNTHTRLVNTIRDSDDNSIGKTRKKWYQVWKWCGWC